MLKLREPNINDKEKILDMINEIKNYDGNFEGLSIFSNIDDYNLWLKKIEDNKYQERINKDYSPQTTYLLVDEEDNIIGGANIRHVLKGELINYGGNVGYLIRPNKRKKGYGSLLLSLALIECKKRGLSKVLIGCRKENIASAKVIEHNGGIYENDYYDQNNKNTYKRYWININ